MALLVCQCVVNFLTGIFPSAIPSDSMSNLSKIRFHSSIGIDEEAFDVKVYVLLGTNKIFITKLGCLRTVCKP